MSESRIQSLVRLAAARLGMHLWRNNRGAGKLESGSYMRFGLANDSKALGDKLKSADLIGWRPVLVTPDMVGRTLAQFVSVEVKDPDGRTHRATLEAQERWRDLVNRDGGYAVIVDDPSQLVG